MKQNKPQAKQEPPTIIELDEIQAAAMQGRMETLQRARIAVAEASAAAEAMAGKIAGARGLTIPNGSSVQFNLKDGKATIEWARSAGAPAAAPANGNGAKGAKILRGPRPKPEPEPVGAGTPANAPAAKEA